MYNIYRFWTNGYKELLEEGVPFAYARDYCDSAIPHGVDENGKVWFESYAMELDKEDEAERELV